MRRLDQRRPGQRDWYTRCLHNYVHPQTLYGMPWTLRHWWHSCPSDRTDEDNSWARWVMFVKTGSYQRE